MKKFQYLLLLLLFVGSFTTAYCQSAESEKSTKEDTEEVLSVVDEMPEFPGGMEKMMAFLSKEIVYPKSAVDANQEGKVYVLFIVSKRGKLSDFEIVRGLGNELDNEALRAVKNMPKWKPGKQGSKRVKVKVVIPIEFKIAA